MKPSVFALALTLLSAPIDACPKCRPLVEAGIQTDFTSIALGLAAPLVVILGCGIAIYYADSWRARRTTRTKV